MEIQYLEPEINSLLASMVDAPSVYEAYYKLHSIMEYRREGTTPTNLGLYEDSAEGTNSLRFKIAKKYVEIVVPTLDGELLDIFNLILSCTSYHHAESILLRQIAAIMVSFARKGGSQSDVWILVHCLGSYYYLNPDIPEEVADVCPKRDICNLLSETLVGMLQLWLQEFRFDFSSWKNL